jgi:protein-L-isoaspartate(D-aspartate) O-methyltransferase
VKFKNDVPGLASHLLQGFALDGRHVPVITLSASFRCNDVRAGPDAGDLPVVALSFYDENRTEVGTAIIGPFRGTRTWANHDRRIDVPESSREAIVRIGMFGAVGEASFDNVFVRKAAD